MTAITELRMIYNNLKHCFTDMFYYYNNETLMTCGTTKYGSGKLYVFPGSYKDQLKNFIIQENGEWYSNLKINIS